MGRGSIKFTLLDGCWANWVMEKWACCRRFELVEKRIPKLMGAKGAPVRTGLASPLRVATGGEASWRLESSSPPLAGPREQHGAGTIWVKNRNEIMNRKCYLCPRSKV